MAKNKKKSKAKKAAKKVQQQAPAPLAPAEAALVKELGFSGIGYTGATRIPEMLAAVKQHGISFAPLYNGIEVRDNGVTHNPNLEKAITEASGREAIIWVYVGGRRQAIPTIQDHSLENK